MAVHLKPKNAQELLTIDGVQLFVGQAGIKKPDYNDVTLMVLSPNSRVAGVFTQNRYCAAPVRVCQELLPSNNIRALVVNTGNANAGTGEDGLKRARGVRAGGRTNQVRSPPSVAAFKRREFGAFATRENPNRHQENEARALGRGRQSHHDHRHGGQIGQP